MRALSRDHLREADRRASAELGIPSICLMENAGAGAAQLALRMRAVHRVTVLCGPGQNGGDGFVVARHVAVAGARVVLVRIGGSDAAPRGDAATNFRACVSMGLPLVSVRNGADVRAATRAMQRADLVVDGLFGTGLRRPLEDVAAELVRAANASARRVLALDVPSGLDCETGRPLGECVMASVTATFGASKLGFAKRGARRWTGRVVVVPIGAPI